MRWEILLAVDPGNPDPWYTVDSGHWYTGIINWITAFLDYPGDTLVVICLIGFFWLIVKHNL